MSFVQVQKMNRGGGNTPKLWREVPCLRIGKTTISLNDVFVSAYGIKDASRIHVFIDCDRPRIGIKKCTEGDDLNVAFKVRADDRKKASGAAQRVMATFTCKAIQSRFQDRVGLTFRAILNHGERIIEVDLSEPVK